MNGITQNKEQNCNKICTDHVFVFHGESEHLRISVNDIVHLKAADNFIRINRSYIINIGCISKIAGNLIEMDDGSELAIGKTYKEAVMSKFIFIGSRKR